MNQCIKYLKPLIARLAYYYRKKLIGKSIHYFLTNPVSAQQQFLDRFHQQLSQTSHAVDQHEQLPLTTGRQFQYHVYDEVNGKSQLWSSKPIAYAASSGTSWGKKKLIPVYPEIVTLNKKIWMYMGVLIADYLGDGGFFTKPHIGLWWTFQAIDPVLVGDVSAILMSVGDSFHQAMAWLTKEEMLLPWTEKKQLLLEKLPQMKSPVLYGVTSRMTDILESVSHNFDDDEWRDQRFSQLVLVWWWVDKWPFLPRLKALWVQESNMIGVYNASEWIFGIEAVDLPERHQILTTLWLPHKTVYRLLPSCYYEFVPAHQIETDVRDEYCYNQHDLDIYSRETLDESMIWQTVALVITTPGQHRVIIDLIKIVALDPLLYTIEWRVWWMINIAGEELIESDLVELARRRNTHFTTQIDNGEMMRLDENMTVAPWRGEKPVHERLIELPRNMIDDHQLRQTMTTHLDRFLREINHDYHVKRGNDNDPNNQLLAQPMIRCIPQWTLYQALWGRTGWQQKIPRIRADRGFIEKVLWLRE